VPISTYEKSLRIHFDRSKVKYRPTSICIAHFYAKRLKCAQRWITQFYLFFGCKNAVVVPAVQRLDRGPVKSRVGTEVLSMADREYESAYGKGKPRVGFELTSGQFGNDGSVFIE